MTLLLLAVPLQKTWLGTHYWKVPSVMELPVELEYIPYHEFEERFKKLNSIAGPIYPTIWPNVAMCLFLLGLFVTAIVGISSSEKTGVTFMGQGACFVLPVIGVLWIRVRKEATAKSRKKFKQRSQKFLRSWTAQDTAAFAIQWKLRVRLKKIVMSRQRYIPEALDFNLSPQQIEEILVNGNQQQNPSTVLQNHEPRQNNNIENTNNRFQEQPNQTAPIVVVEDLSGRALTALETNTSTSPTITVPRRVADVYSALSVPTPNTTQQQPQIHLTEPGVIPMSPRSSLPQAPQRSKWEIWREILSEVYCLKRLFREPKIWVIEISIREGQLDEYSIPVPSPAYCDYRLPEYEDVINGGSARTSANPVRYSGMPPAYESDSENESNDEEEEEEEEEGERGLNNTQSNDVRLGPLGRTSLHTGRNSIGLNVPPSQNPVEMVSVTISSNTIGTPRVSLGNDET